jgi:hypothetical protein
MALTRAFVAEDKSSVEIHLAVVGGPPLVLTMSPNSLGQIVSGLTELDSAVQIQIGSTTGHFATHAADVQDLTVQAAAGGDKVILSFCNSAGRFQSFAVAVEQALQLRVDMKKAEARARGLASKSRN